jgi:tetratricopeptide (TPR) repeat protein
MAFIEALDTLARSGWVWIIAALRSDFYPRCSEYEKLVALKDGAGQYDLLPPTPAEIGQMIRQPAQAAGLHFGEDSTTKERLDETLRDAASKDPGCLALLEFTLEELYKNRTEKGFLTQEAYKGLRGVEGALAQRAEAVYDGLEVDVKSAFGPIFHELVSIGLGEEDIITRKYAPLDLISSDTKSKKFVEAFIESRLFVSDLDDKDNAVVSVAHEALLQHWPRLQEWVEKNNEDLRAHARVSAAASRWMEEGKSKDYLLTAGKPLAEAEELTKISSLDLREEERSFIATSIAKKRRIKWLKRGVVVAMALLTVIAVSMAYIANKQQQRAQIEAQTSNQVSEFLVNLFEVSDPSEARGNSITAREVLDKGVAKVEEELKDQPEIQARLMTTMGMVYQSLGLYEAASPMLENALSIRKELHGEEHPMVCISINNLAGLMKDKGEYDQSETLLREALDTHKKLKGDQREYTEILNTLALLLLDRGRYEEAEPLFRELLSINRKIRDEKDPIIASSLNNLGLALHYKGEYEEAEQYYREAIRIIRGVSGDFNPQLAQDLGNLALLLMDKGDLAGAEPLFREALAIEKKVYSEPHPEIAITLNNLAAMLQTTGEYKEAENLYEESLNIAREVWKNGHPSIASTLTSLAVLLAKQQEYDKAEPLFRDALAMHKKLLGDEHPSVAFSLSNLAVLLGKKQEYDKAEPLFREALQMRRKLLGNEHVDIAVSLNNLARLYLEQHEYGKAEPLFREALSMFRKLVGDSHPTIASILINMATLQFKQGNYHDAEPLYRECYDTRKKTLPEGHPLTISGKRELGNCLAKLERFEEAEKLLLECCENLESQSEPNASEIKKTLGYIVDLYTMWNKPKKAGEYRTKLKGLSEQ